MKRSMCGIIVLAAAAGLWSCNGDPTGNFRETGITVVPDPSSVFVDQGASKFVVVEATDEQGNQLAADFQAQNIGAGITVEKDTTFLQTTIGTHLETSARFIVTGVGPGSTSFDVTGAGATTTVPVRVVPTSFAATISNPAPAVNEEVTITLPAGYRFIAGAGASTDQGTAVVRSFSADSTAIVVVLPPGSTTLALDSVQAAFLPGVTLAGLPAEVTLTADATPAAGTGSTATAPTLPVPAALDGSSTVFFDVGTFTAADVTVDGGVGAQYYKLVITQAGDYTITTDWPPASPADIDAVQCASGGCAGASTFVGTGTTHPEQGTLTLAPGTYFLAVILFAGTAPSNFNIQISAVPTPAP